ncbi:MAG: carboxypeptidase regulatory-like domain-containing protein [Candidatus Kapabacteria bacterium]|nr:carboxypeptidase regulatory-like domain-containing protein [Candidatus Kapabacteria bacterium]
MRKFYTLVLLACLYVTSCIDEPVVEAPIVADGKIVGYVHDNKTLEPLQNALVSSEPATESVLSDSEGYFYLGNASPGTYRIIATKEDYYLGNVSISVKSDKETRAYVKLTAKVDANNAPELPIIEFPASGALVYDDTTNIVWSCIDIDGDKLTYDVYCDTVNPPIYKVANRISKSEFHVENLKDSMKYYIRIVAYDIYDAMTESDVSHFTTRFRTQFDLNDVELYLSFNGHTLDQGKYLLQTAPHNIQFAQDRNGVEDGAVYFNGTSSKISIPSDLTNIGEDYTIMFWIFPDNSMGKTNKTDNNIFGKWGPIAPANASYVFYIYSTNTFYFRVCDGESYESHVKAPIPAKAIWTHIAIVSNKGRMVLYVNGNMISEIVSGNPQKSGLPLVIGASDDGSSYFRGRIDEFYMLSKPLDHVSIKKMMQY